eukprot:scaffold4833_cov21-Tisochrysis_lutea.AAC.2
MGLALACIPASLLLMFDDTRVLGQEAEGLLKAKRLRSCSRSVTVLLMQRRHGVLLMQTWGIADAVQTWGAADANMGTAEMQLALTQSEVFTQRPEVWQCYSGTHLLCKRHAFAFARKHRVYAS